MGGLLVSRRRGVGRILVACLQLLGTSSQLPAWRRVWGGGCHHDGDTETTKVMRLWFSFFPHRECRMELLQEELDRMEMSCLQGESWPGRGTGER